MVRLFVGGLPEDITTADLTARFTPFGQVTSIELIGAKDALGHGHSHAQSTAACRGFAYLDLQPKDDHAVHKCLSVYNHSKWRGRVLRVEIAKLHYMEKLRGEWHLEQQQSDGKPLPTPQQEQEPGDADNGESAQSKELHMNNPLNKWKPIKVDLEQPAYPPKRAFPPAPQQPLTKLPWDYDRAAPASAVYLLNEVREQPMQPYRPNGIVFVDGQPQLASSVEARKGGAAFAAPAGTYSEPVKKEMSRELFSSLKILKSIDTEVKKQAQEALAVAARAAVGKARGKGQGAQPASAPAMAFVAAGTADQANETGGVVEFYQEAADAADAGPGARELARFGDDSSDDGGDAAQEGSGDEQLEGSGGGDDSMHHDGVDGGTGIDIVSGGSMEDEGMHPGSDGECDAGSDSGAMDDSSGSNPEEDAAGAQKYARGGPGELRSAGMAGSAPGAALCVQPEEPAVGSKKRRRNDGGEPPAHGQAQQQQPPPPQQQQQHVAKYMRQAAGEARPSPAFAAPPKKALGAAADNGGGKVRGDRWLAVPLVRGVKASGMAASLDRFGSDSEEAFADVEASDEELGASHGPARGSGLSSRQPGTAAAPGAAAGAAVGAGKEAPLPSPAGGADVGKEALRRKGAADRAGAVAVSRPAVTVQQPQAPRAAAARASLAAAAETKSAAVAATATPQAAASKQAAAQRATPPGLDPARTDCPDAAAFRVPSRPSGTRPAAGAEDLDRFGCDSDESFHDVADSDDGGEGCAAAGGSKKAAQQLVPVGAHASMHPRRPLGSLSGKRPGAMSKLQAHRR